MLAAGVGLAFEPRLPLRWSPALPSLGAVVVLLGVSMLVQRGFFA
jgi:hypothetical protein